MKERRKYVPEKAFELMKVLEAAQVPYTTEYSKYAFPSHDVFDIIFGAADPAGYRWVIRFETGKPTQSFLTETV